MEKEIIDIIKEYFSIIEGGDLKSVDNQGKTIDDIEDIFKREKTSVEKLKKLFLKLLQLRNTIARERFGELNYFELQKNRKYRIPGLEMKKYDDNKDKLVGDFKVNMEIVFPNFYSLIEIPNIDYPASVFNFDKRFIELLNKVSIKSSSNGANYKYSADTGKYSVYIPEAPVVQKVSMLIHELSHVVVHEREKNMIDSVYTDEIEAMKVEFEIDKSVSKDLFEANVRTYLYSLLRTDFQKNVFTGDADLEICYRTLRGRYFGKLNENLGNLYLLDKSLVLQPLKDMASAMAAVNALYAGMKPVVVS